MMTDDLIARLRDAANRGSLLNVEAALFREAAAALRERDEFNATYRKACDGEVMRQTHRAERAEAERDAAREQLRQMVEKAAAQSLDGYRELGARAAAAENDRDRLLALLRDCSHYMRGGIGRHSADILADVDAALEDRHD